MIGFIKNLLSYHTISYGVTVCNEVEEIRILLDFLIHHIDPDDEIIVLQDVTQENIEISEILKSYGSKIKRISARLDGDFATFKNHLIASASKKYLFQIDADEIPQKLLLKNLKKILFTNYKNNVFLVPRINIVEGIQPYHIEKWSWNMNEKGYINFPDFQQRIFKLNCNINWENKVHETLAGNIKARLIEDKDYKQCLLHIKRLERQVQQNQFYDKIMPIKGQ